MLRNIPAEDFDITDVEKYGKIYSTHIEKNKSEFVVETTLGFIVVYQGNNISIQGNVTYIDRIPFMDLNGAIKSSLKPIRVFQGQPKKAEIPPELQRSEEMIRRLENKFGTPFRVTYTRNPSKQTIPQVSPPPTSISSQNAESFIPYVQELGLRAEHTETGLKFFNNGKPFDPEKPSDLFSTMIKPGQK